MDFIDNIQSHITADEWLIFGIVAFVLLVFYMMFSRDKNRMRPHRHEPAKRPAEPISWARTYNFLLKLICAAALAGIFYYLWTN